jgi:sugar lactone lactonase YvrE
MSWFRLGCASTLAFFCCYVFSGCSNSSNPVTGFGGALTGHAIHGIVHGGNQPVTGATLQLYAATASTNGGPSLALISAVITSSDGSGTMNANANAGNANNTLQAGGFTITGDYTCPSAASQVYFVASGGNPGQASGTYNAQAVFMAPLGSCGLLSASTGLSVNEVTTVGMVAALYPFMSGYSGIGSLSGASGALAEAFSTATEYINAASGAAPGPNLPAGYYASSLEINTLANVMASCVNTAGGAYNDGTNCGTLFYDTKPATGSAATDTVGALLRILQNPTNNVTQIFNQAAPAAAFSPALAAAPANWTLPIVPIPRVNFSPVAGSYGNAASVTISSPVPGAAIYYTTDGTTPTTASSVYSAAIAVSSSETLNALAVSSRTTGYVGTASYVIGATPATPVISLAAGTYASPEATTISASPLDASIYFTTDGTTPTASSNQCTGSVGVATSETLKAVAIVNGVSSGVASAAYTIAPPSGTIYTFAGGGGTASGNVATNAALTTPSAVLVDPSGNIYISDTGNAIVRLVSAATGIMTTVAGTGTPGYAPSQDGGPATSAQLTTPEGLALDLSGNLYIADSGNNRIRMVAAGTGIITTVAGTGTAGYVAAQDGNAATSAELNGPYGVAVDASGNLYIGDTTNQRIRMVTAGIITTVAGTGVNGYVAAQDGALAVSAELSNPRGLSLDGSGNLFIADTNNSRIRRIDVGTGIITTVAGITPARGATEAGDGGLATAATMKTPYSVAVDPVGNIFITDPGFERIREVAASTGIITTVAGTGTAGSTIDPGTATSAKLNSPYGVALDSNGNYYIADASNNRVRKVSGGTITTIAGVYAGTGNFSGDGGAATSAQLYIPTGMSFDASGNLFFADSGNNRVRKVSGGSITTVAGNGTTTATENVTALNTGISYPFALAFDPGGNLYITDVRNALVREVTAGTNIVTAFAGNGTTGYDGDGQAANGANTEINYPYAMTIDPSGNVFIADTINNRVRMVAVGTGIITTIAGTGTGLFNGDGAATSSNLYYPDGVVLDANGNLFIADEANDRIRMVANAATGGNTMITIAGNGTAGYSGDGNVPTNSEIDAPHGLAIDSSGNLYIADSQNSCIRKVTSPATVTGVITTVAGICNSSVTGFSGDGGPATSARLALPSDVKVDANGVLYISDTNNNRIRVVYP